MSAPKVELIRHIPGRLIKDPTTRDSASPYGGTYLGMTRNIIVLIGYESHAIPDEATGGRPIDYTQGREYAYLTCFLRGFDDDAIRTFFPNTSTGPVSGAAVIDGSVNGADRAGPLQSARAFKLLFEPTSPLHHEAVLFYNAIPRAIETGELALALNSEIGISVAVEGAPNVSGKTKKICKIEDMASDFS